MNEPDKGTERQPNGKPSSRLGAAAFVLVLLFAFAAYAYSRTQRPEPQPSIPVPEAPAAERGTGTPAPTGTTTEPVAEAKTFTVRGSNFTFSPLEMRVRRGDQVKIVFVNEEGFHDWVLDEFNARTPQIAAGATAEVEFTADRSGTFEYYCSVGSHRAMGMVGKLTVE